MSRPDLRRRLLLVYHSKTGRTRRLAEAAAAGAAHPDAGIDLRFLHAATACADDLLWAHGLLIGTPENFGQVAGAVKEFLDRTFYEVEGRLRPLPYALFVSAGNDGSGAVRGIERIANGYPLVRVQPPLVVRGEPADADLARCTQLGMTLAFGLDAGIY
jgi:multimeric flavodoxin WrbA